MLHQWIVDGRVAAADTAWALLGTWGYVRRRGLASSRWARVEADLRTVHNQHCCVVESFASYSRGYFRSSEVVLLIYWMSQVAPAMECSLR